MRRWLSQAPALSHSAYRGERYFRSLDGLRAISILLVLTWHVNSTLWGWLSGWSGVSIFFVISGFLITTLCLREEERDGSVSLKAFYVRRACRILPLYYVVLGFYILFVIGLNWHDERAALVRSLPYYLFYLNDFSPHLSDPGTPFTLSWSLGVEEKFYLVWPLLAFVLLRGRARFRVAAATALVVVAAIGFDRRELYLHYSQIMVGCLLALVLHDKRGFERLGRVLRREWLVLAVFVAAQAVLFTDAYGVGKYFYAPAVGLLIGAMIVSRPAWAKPLVSRVMIYIGKRSYGVYLVQMICLSILISFVRHVHPAAVFNSKDEPAGSGAWPLSLMLLVAGTAASLAAAEVLHRTVEAPMINLGRVWSRRITGKAPVAPPRMAHDGLPLVAPPRGDLEPAQRSGAPQVGREPGLAPDAPA